MKKFYYFVVLAFFPCVARDVVLPKVDLFGKGSIYAVNFVDYDGDGDFDIAVASAHNSPNNGIWRNEGNG